MPTATTLLDIYSVTNYGPLTTPFTPDPSCLSATNIGIGRSILISQINFVDCSIKEPDEACFPSPTDSGAIQSVWESQHEAGPSQFQPFYSPATACPSGYSTAMTAARDASGNASLSGWYPTPTFTEGSDETPVPTVFAPPDVLVALLDDNETAVWCCPSGFDAGHAGICLSTLEDYTFSTGCNTFYPSGFFTSFTTEYPGLDGETTEGELIMVTGGAEPTISTYTFGCEDSVSTADLIAYATHTPIVVVHRAEDLDEEEEDDGGDNGDDSQEDENSNQDEDAEDPTPTGAAARIDGGGFVVSWGAGAAALVASAVVGASMVLFT